MTTQVHNESNDSGTPEPMVPLCSVFRRFLRSQNLKYTTERADVLQAIIEHDDYFEAEELLLKMRAHGHRVSKATIYRTLRLLQDAGIITQALFDSKQSHFQLIYGRAPRHSMLCLRSGKTIDFQNDELASLRDQICQDRDHQRIRQHLYAISQLATELEL